MNVALERNLLEQVWESVVFENLVIKTVFLFLIPKMTSRHEF